MKMKLVKKAPNFLQVTTPIPVETITAFLTYATHFAFKSDEEKLEIIKGFGILPPDNPILVVDEMFNVDFSPVNVSKQVEKIVLVMAITCLLLPKTLWRIGHSPGWSQTKQENM